MATHDVLYIIVWCLSALVFVFYGYMARDESITQGDYKDSYRHWQSGYNVGRKNGYKSGFEAGKWAAVDIRDKKAIKDACRNMQAILKELDGEKE